MGRAGKLKSLKRLSNKFGSLASVFFTSPLVRFVSAALIALSLTLGALAANESQIAYGWLPGWYSDVYVVLAAVLAVQPLIGSVFDAFTKRRINRLLRKRMDEALGELADPVREIARITYEQLWEEFTTRSFERQAVRIIQQLFKSIEMPEPRVCFYVVSATDVTSYNKSGFRPVNEIQYVTHHGGKSPSRIFRRNDDDASGLFDALDSGQPSREDNREGYNPEVHHWRSALRIPVALDDTQYGVLTLDSPLKGAVNTGHDKILGFGAALIGLARLCESQGIGPSATDVLKNFTSK